MHDKDFLRKILDQTNGRDVSKHCSLTLGHAYWKGSNIPILRVEPAGKRLPLFHHRLYICWRRSRRLKVGAEPNVIVGVRPNVIQIQVPYARHRTIVPVGTRDRAQHIKAFPAVAHGQSNRQSFSQVHQSCATMHNNDGIQG